jgi:hypothetical protein
MEKKVSKMKESRQIKYFSLFILLILVVMVFGACTFSPTSVRKIGALNTGTAYQVAVRGDIAYVATNDGVVVVDISTRNRPKEIAVVELSEAAFGVDVQDDLVFIAAPSDGLVIADVQEPSSPKIIGTYPAGGISDVCINGHLAFAGTQQGELHILTIEDPTHPILLNSYQSNGGLSLMVACHRDTIYFSTSSNGMGVFDVSNPSTPVKMMAVPNTFGAKDTHMVGDFLYLACHQNGVRILDITDPRSPKTVATFNDGGEAWGVGGNAQILWIGDLQQGVKIYDVSDPQSPLRLTNASRYAPHDIFFDGQYAYLADQDRGFIVLEYAGDT